MFAGSLIVNSPAGAFSSTTLSAGSFPSLPSLATVTLPFSSTVISSSVNPKSGFAALIASFTACFSSLVNASFFATGTLFAGSLIVNSPAGAFSSTKSVPLIVSTDPSGYVIVAVPSAPTSTFVGCCPSFACGNLSLFASSTAFLTASFSSFVKFVLSATFVFSGTTGVVSSACVLASATATVASTLSVEPSL